MFDFRSFLADVDRRRAELEQADRTKAEIEKLNLENRRQCAIDALLREYDRIVDNALRKPLPL